MVNASTPTPKLPRSHSATYLTTTLPTAVPPIFDQVQHTTANHRKNIVALKKIQDACSTVTERVERSGKSGYKLVGEKAFNTLFVDMVNRVLAIKKGVSVADRVIKFVASYVTYAQEQGQSGPQPWAVVWCNFKPADIGQTVDSTKRGEGEDEIDTPSTRFIAKLLRHLLSGMEAKDKNVRFRVTLLSVSMINGLGEIEWVGVALNTSTDH